MLYISKICLITSDENLPQEDSDKEELNIEDMCEVDNLAHVIGNIGEI